MTAALMMTIGFFNTPKMTGTIAAIFIPLLSEDCRGNRIKKCKRKNSWLPVVGRSAEPLDYLVSVGNETSKGIAVAHTRSARLVAFEVSLGKMIASARESAVE